MRCSSSAIGLTEYMHSTWSGNAAALACRCFPGKVKSFLPLRPEVRRRVGRLAMVIISQLQAPTPGYASSVATKRDRSSRKRKQEKRKEATRLQPDRTRGAVCNAYSTEAGVQLQRTARGALGKTHVNELQSDRRMEARPWRKLK